MSLTGAGTTNERVATTSLARRDVMRELDREVNSLQAAPAVARPRAFTKSLQFARCASHGLMVDNGQNTQNGQEWRVTTTLSVRLKAGQVAMLSHSVPLLSWIISRKAGKRVDKPFLVDVRAHGCH